MPCHSNKYFKANQKIYSKYVSLKFIWKTKREREREKENERDSVLVAAVPKEFGNKYSSFPSHDFDKIRSKKCSFGNSALSYYLQHMSSKFMNPAFIAMKFPILMRMSWNDVTPVLFGLLEHQNWMRLQRPSSSSTSYCSWGSWGSESRVTWAPWRVAAELPWGPSLYHFLWRSLLYWVLNKFCRFRWSLYMVFWCAMVKQKCWLNDCGLWYVR